MIKYVLKLTDKGFCWSCVVLIKMSIQRNLLLMSQYIWQRIRMYMNTMTTNSLTKFQLFSIDLLISFRSKFGNGFGWLTFVVMLCTSSYQLMNNQAVPFLLIVSSSFSFFWWSIQIYSLMQSNVKTCIKIAKME